MFLINYVKNSAPLVLSQEYISDRLNIAYRMIHNTLRYMPTELSTQSSEHYSAHYQQKYEDEYQDTLLLTWLVEKITYSISLTSYDSKARLSFWGSLPASEEQAKEFYLLQHALLFKATGLGNSSYRAAYAAIELAKFFLSTSAGLDVKLRSYPAIDHFVVMIGSDAHGWKIYDPLTNPELIFDEEKYNTNIKSLFKLVSSPKLPYEFTITRDVIIKADFFARKMIKLLETEVDKLSLASLQKDDNYFSFLQLEGISDPRFEKTNAAITRLRETTYGESVCQSYVIS